MSIYLIGNSMTNEHIDRAIQINSHEEIKSGRFSYPKNQVMTIAVNGGPGSGKGSFEKGVVRKLSELDPDSVIILIAESARDIIDGLKDEGKLESTGGEELTSLIVAEQQRRREVAEHLSSTFFGKNIYMIYDRDQANCPVYDCFFKHFNFDTETLDQDSFYDSFSAYPGIDGLADQMRELFDLVLVMDPVRHETNYACAHPKVEGAPIDTTRRESYKMAQEIHKASVIGAQHVYGQSLVIVPNTDEQDPVKRNDTIGLRVNSQLSLISTTLADIKKSSYRYPVLTR